MAYAHKHIQLTWGGSYFTDDIWINGLHLIDTSLVVSDALDLVFNATTLYDISNVIATVHTSQWGNAPQAELEWFKMALIGTDGKYIGDPIVSDVPAAAGGQTGTLFPQLATAVTLRSDKKRGPAAYGRYYAPVALTVQSTGRVSQPVIDQFVGSQQTMLTNLNIALANNDVSNNVVIGNVSKVGAGSQEPVTGVFVGDLVDTQRRRRNKLNEVYTGLSI